MLMGALMVDSEINGITVLRRSWPRRKGTVSDKVPFGGGGKKYFWLNVKCFVIQNTNR